MLMQSYKEIEASFEDTPAMFSLQGQLQWTLAGHGRDRAKWRLCHPCRQGGARSVGWRVIVFVSSAITLVVLQCWLTENSICGMKSTSVCVRGGLIPHNRPPRSDCEYRGVEPARYLQ